MSNRARQRREAIKGQHRVVTQRLSVLNESTQNLAELLRDSMATVNADDTMQPVDMVPGLLVGLTQSNIAVAHAVMAASAEATLTALAVDPRDAVADSDLPADVLAERERRADLLEDARDVLDAANSPTARQRSVIERLMAEVEAVDQ